MPPSEPSRKRPGHIFYGWYIVAGGFCIQLLNGGLLFHAFSAYILPLQAEFGWSRASLSGAYSMARAESGILGPFQGWLIDRYGPRASMVVGNLLFGLGFILFSRMDSLLTFYLSFALIALGSSLGGFMPLATTVTNWFVRRRATALGRTLVGMGVGGLFIPAIAWSLSTYGWRTTSFTSGLLVLAVALPISLLMRHKPEQYGYLPDGDPPEDQPDAIDSDKRRPRRSTDPGFTARQALRTPTFWFLSVGHAAALLVVGAVLVHQIPHMVTQIGLSQEEAAAYVALLVTVNIAALLLGGYLGDRIDKRLTMFVCMWMHAISLFIFAFATTRLEVIAFAVLHGAAWGTRGLLINAIRADYFGRAAYASITGFNSLIVMIGMTGGPLFSGFLYDLAGDYQFAFLVLAALSALGSAAIFLARKPTPPTARA